MVRVQVPGAHGTCPICIAQVMINNTYFIICVGTSFASGGSSRVHHPTRKSAERVKILPARSACKNKEGSECEPLLILHVMIYILLFLRQAEAR